MTTLSLTERRFYAFTPLFIAGNVVLPQLCHLIPQGGLILLPIYFFTLVAGYRFGMAAGLATAICSPLVNHLLFGMPSAAVLPILLFKSVALALAAALVARRLGRATLGGIALTVVAYQLVGILFEWPMTGSLQAAVQDVVLGYPGLLIQVFVGYWTISRIAE
ncbi:MAG: ECF transporter S component [Bacteroidaceae bacterium]|nr:ECF transporter S component [Bacteroidaceae bacterium]